MVEWVALGASLVVVVLASVPAAYRVDARRYFAFNPPAPKRKNLVLALRAFDDLGYVEVEEGSRDEFIKQPTWHVYWSWPMFSKAKYKLVRNEKQRMNHIPGNAGIVVKSMLFSTLEKAAERFHGAFDFYPEQYLMPRDNDKLIRLRTQGSEKDPLWLKKDANHRGVRLLSHVALDMMLLHRPQKAIISQYIDPLLLDGFKWDLGIYVLVAGIHPLRIYIHKNALLRVCRKKYPVPKPSSKDDTETYVIGAQYDPPWSNRDLAKHFAVLPTQTDQGTYTMRALIKCLDEKQPGTGSRAMASMKEAAIKTVLANLENFRKKSTASSRFRDSFFELFRMDFNIDENGKPWLLEVNMSPNLSPHHWAKGKVGSDTALKTSVVEDALRIVTPALHSFSRREEARGDFSQACLHLFDLGIISNLEKCVPEEYRGIKDLQALKVVLQEAAAAHKGTAYELVFPPNLHEGSADLTAYESFNGLFSTATLDWTLHRINAFKNKQSDTWRDPFEAAKAGRCSDGSRCAFASECVSGPCSELEAQPKKLKSCSIACMLETSGMVLCFIQLCLGMIFFWAFSRSLMMRRGAKKSIA